MKSKRSLIVQVSNHCPCYCPGCYNVFAKTELPTYALLQFLSVYQIEFGITKLTISGGDPLLRDDIAAILDVLLHRGLNISVDTVGSTLLKRSEDKFLMRTLKKVQYLGLPLDGLTTETIHLFRHGISYEESMDAIRFAAAQQIPLCINTVVHTGNIHEILNMYSVISAFEQVHKWQLFQYMPIGPGGSTYRDVFSIRKQQFNTLADKLSQSPSRADLQIQPKSLAARKNQYLLLGCDGMIWIPQQTDGREWDAEQDENAGRVIIGSVEEKDIIQRIKDVFAQ